MEQAPLPTILCTIPYYIPCKTPHLPVMQCVTGRYGHLWIVSGGQCEHLACSKISVVHKKDFNMCTSLSRLGQSQLSTNPPGKALIVNSPCFLQHPLQVCKVLIGVYILCMLRRHRHKPCIVAKHMTSVLFLTRLLPSIGNWRYMQAICS